MGWGLWRSRSMLSRAIARGSFRVGATRSSWSNARAEDLRPPRPPGAVAIDPSQPEGSCPTGLDEGSYRRWARQRR
eukprot:scaffold169688_cov29-Tisochrysis_lutea.AAC.6